MTTIDPPEWTADEVAAWRPPEDVTVSQWADQHRWLDPRVSAEPGKYKSDRTPYAREWMDCTNSAWIRQVTIIAGTQLGKTESLHNVLGFVIAQDPGPSMVVMPRNPDVRMITQRRLLPMVESSPVLTGELTEGKHDVKNVEIAFRRSIVYVRSAQSPADLASAPVRFVLADEVDKYPEWTGEEAAPLDLARERTKTFWNRIVFVTTTPTTRDAVGWSEFEDGDQRRYHLPCPHCGTFDYLKWENVKWSDGATAKQLEEGDERAWYVCPHCDGEITDAHKRTMLPRGVWIPEAFTYEEWVHGGARENDRTAHRSYHLSSLYSPWLTFSDVAAKFLQSKGRPSRLQNVVNSWFAEPFEDQVDATTTSDLEKCKVAGWRLDAGKIPSDVLVATAGADVQKDRIWVVVRGWGWDDLSRLLYAGYVDDFAALDSLLFRNRWTSTGAPIRHGFIDSRYRRSETVKFCGKRRTMKLCQGVDTTAPVDFEVKKLDKDPDDGKPLKKSLQLWSITVARFKDSLAERVEDPAKWMLPEDLPDDYELHVTAEHKVRKRVRGKLRAIWVPKPGRDANHLLDCEVYAMASGRAIRVETLRSDQRPPPPPSPPARPPTPPPRYPTL